MREEVIFEVTKNHLDKGLREIPVGHCSTSYIDPKKGVFYVGRPLFEISLWDPMSVIYLLYHGREPTIEEVKAFEKEIQKRAFLKLETVEELKKLPFKELLDPVDLFTLAVTFLGMFEKTEDYREDCFNIIAKIPLVAAIIMNHHGKFGNTYAFDGQKRYIDHFLHLLNIPEKEELRDLLRLHTILHFDHGGGSPEAFVGKIVASNQEHLYGSLVGGLRAFFGSLNGRASQNCFSLIQEIYAGDENNISVERIEKILSEKLAKKERIFGFGHPHLQAEDSRATMLYNFARKHFSHDPLVKIALLLRTEAPRLLKEKSRARHPYPNIDAISGALLSASGFKYPEYFPILSGFARCIGMAIQILDEKCSQEKEVPLASPHYFYRAKS
jgi:citrate synthase